MTVRVHNNQQATQAQLRDTWGSLTWLANHDTIGAERLAMARVVIRKGQSNPRHAHPTCEELLYLMRGSLRHSVGDEHVVLHAGDTLLIPAGVFHNAESIGDEDADMIVTYSNGRRDFVLEDASSKPGCGAER